jgi:hypothetical protein
VKEAVRMPKRLNRLLLAGAVLAALAFIAGGAIGAHDSGPAKDPPAKKPPAKKPPAADPRGYPRLLSLQSCSNDRFIARHDMVVGYGYCDIRKLRALDPKAIFLVQPGLYPQGRNPAGESDYGNVNATYGSGYYYWRGACDKFKGGKNLGCIRGFNESYDLLHNADGSRAGVDGGVDGFRGYNLADPLKHGVPMLIAQMIAYAAKLDGLYARGWDGVWLDNWIYGIIGQPIFYGPNLDTDGDGKPDDPATLRRNWDNGVNEMGTLLRSYVPGKIVAGNGNWFAAVPNQYFGDDPNGWLKTANLTTFEAIDRIGDKPANLLGITARWLRYPDPDKQPRYAIYLQNAQTADGTRLTVPAGTDPNQATYMLDPAVLRSMRWGLTVSLMGGAYYELMLNADTATEWWYDEYDGGKGVRRRNYLGQALGPAVVLQPDVRRRDFQNGIALNNSSGQPVTIDLKGKFKHLLGTQDPSVNDGSVVTRVTVPDHDGLILLRLKPIQK